MPLYDDGKINPTQLFESTIQVYPQASCLPKALATVVERPAVVGGACIDHPHVDPRFDSDARVRPSTCRTATQRATAGSPTDRVGKSMIA